MDRTYLILICFICGFISGCILSKFSKNKKCSSYDWKDDINKPLK
jgi:hypothetical protein